MNMSRGVENEFWVFSHPIGYLGTLLPGGYRYPQQSEDDLTAAAGK